MSEEGGIAFVSDVLIQGCNDPRSNDYMYIPGYGRGYRCEHPENAQSCTIDISAGNKVNEFYKLITSSRCRESTVEATIHLCSHSELCGPPIQSLNVSCEKLLCSFRYYSLKIGHNKTM